MPHPTKPSPGGTFFGELVVHDLQEIETGYWLGNTRLFGKDFHVELVAAEDFDDGVWIRQRSPDWVSPGAAAAFELMRKFDGDSDFQLIEVPWATGRFVLFITPFAD